VLKRLLASLFFVPALALAQAYPSKPVRMIVPFPAGGPADIFGRGLAQGMAAELGQPVIIENVSGVGGVLGVDRAVKSAPDGYTLALNSASTLSIAPFSFSKLPYDVKKDFALITVVVRVPEVLAVHPSLPVKTLQELIAYAKANPGKVNFGSAGGGSITHLAGELLKAEAKIDMVHVPYKGAAPAATPPDILRRIHAAAVAALRSPAVVEQFAKVAGVASPGTPQEYAAFLAAEQVKWSKIVNAIGFKE